LNDGYRFLLRVECLEVECVLVGFFSLRVLLGFFVFLGGFVLGCFRTPFAVEWRSNEKLYCISRSLGLNLRKKPFCIVGGALVAVAFFLTKRELAFSSLFRTEKTFRTPFAVEWRFNEKLYLYVRAR